MISWILILVGGLWLIYILAINYFIPWLKSAYAYLTTKTAVTPATTVAVNTDQEDMVAGIAACFTITAIAKKRGDVQLAAQVAQVRVTLAGMADDSVAPTA